MYEMYKLMMNPVWEKPAENGGGSEGDVAEEDVVEEDVEEEEDDFEAYLAKQHPDLVKRYQETTSNLLNALRMERTANKEGKKARAELKKYKEAEEERDREGRTELENTQRDLAAEKTARERAETELRQLRDESVILDVAGSLNFNKPKDAVLFVDMGSLERGEDDSLDPKQVETALKALVKERPYLIKSKDLGDGNDTGSGTNRKMDTDPKTKKKIRESQPKLSI